MNGPTVVAINGNFLYVADTGNNRVLVFTIDPVSFTVTSGQSASYVLGQSDFTTATGGTTASKMNGPAGVYYDGGTNLYVADTGNNRVLVFNSDPASISNGEDASYVLGQPDFTTVTPGTTASKMHGPKSIAPDLFNGTSIYVSDTLNNRVLSFPLDPISLTVANGEDASYVLGQSDFTTATGGTTASKMNGPTGLSYYYSNILTYDSNGNITNPSQNLLVSDTGNNRILTFTVDPAIITNGENASHVIGQSDFTTATGGTTLSKMNSPTGVVSDGGTGLYVSDTANNRILIITLNLSAFSDSKIIGFFDSLNNPNGNPGVFPSGFGFSNSAYPGGAVVDSAGHRLFVADSFNNRVLVFQLDSNNRISSPDASYVLGQPDFTTNDTQQGQMGFGNKFIAGLTFDPVYQRLFAPDSLDNRVLVFDVNPATIHNGENATAVIGQPDFTTYTSGVSQTATNGIDDLCYEPTTKRLFTSDELNNRVLVWDASPTYLALHPTGSVALNVLGQQNFTSRTAGNGLNQLTNTTGEACDSNHQLLFTSDFNNDRIMVFDINPATIHDGENASYTLINGSGANIHAGSHNVHNLDDSGYDNVNDRYWVSDSRNNRWLVWSFTPSSPISTNKLPQNNLGQPDWSTVSSGLSQSKVDYIDGGPSFDPVNNRFFVDDVFHGRFLQMSMIHITTSSLPAATKNTSYSQPIAYSYAQGTSQSFSVFSGSFPTGLNLNTSTGTISGTPTVAGTYNFTIEADDNFATGPFFDRATYAMTVNDVSSASTVTVQAATSVTQTTATLNGNLTATGGVNATVEGFNYGLTTGYGTVASTTGTFGTGAYTQAITGLTCNTLYHYQSFATNTSGTGTSADQTFTTSACDVVVSTPSGGAGLVSSPIVTGVVVTPPTSSTTLITSTPIVTPPPTPTPTTVPTTKPTPPANIPLTNNTPVLVNYKNENTCTTKITTYSKYDFGKVDIQLGDKGNKIKELQKFLNKALNLTLPITGTFASKTEDAVKLYQKKNCISIDGIVGPKTRKLIEGR